MHGIDEEGLGDPVGDGGSVPEHLRAATNEVTQGRDDLRPRLVLSFVDR